MVGRLLETSKPQTPLDTECPRIELSGVLWSCRYGNRNGFSGLGHYGRIELLDCHPAIPATTRIAWAEKFSTQAPRFGRDAVTLVCKAPPGVSSLVHLPLGQKTVSRLLN